MQDLQVDSRRVLLIQLVSTLVVAASFAVAKNYFDGLSAFVGGLISISMVLLLVRGVKRATACAVEDPKRSMVILYVGAVQRFVLMIVFFGLALGVAKLEALACFVGFGLAQLSYVLAGQGKKN